MHVRESVWYIYMCVYLFIRVQYVYIHACVCICIFVVYILYVGRRVSYLSTIGGGCLLFEHIF